MHPTKRSRLPVAFASVALVVATAAPACGKDETFQGANGALDASVDADGPDAPIVTSGDAEAGATCAPDASFTFDGENCGRCGRSCGGSSCVEGKCLALTLGTVPSPAGLWVDSSSVWVTSFKDPGGLYQSAKDAPTLKLVAEQAGAWELTAHGGALVWTNWNGIDIGGGLYRRATGTPLKLIDTASPREIVSDGEGVYFIDHYENAVSALLDGAAAKAAIATDIVDRRRALSVDANFAYWGEQEALRIAAAPKRGNGTVRTVVALATPAASTLVDGDWLYVATEQRNMGGECVGGHLTRYPLGADAGVGAPVDLGMAACPTSLVKAGDHVYWAEATRPNGSIRRVNAISLATETVIEGIDSPSHVRVDGAFAYFYEEGPGVVKRAALP